MRTAQMIHEKIERGEIDVTNEVLRLVNIDSLTE